MSQFGQKSIPRGEQMRFMHTVLSTTLALVSVTVCAATAVNAQCTGAVPSRPGAGGEDLWVMPIPQTPNNDAIFAEARSMERYFGLPKTSLYVNSKFNAFSDESLGISLGQPLHDAVLAKASNMGTPALYTAGYFFIFAHEYAHQFQFKKLRNPKARGSVHMELQADVMGAYYAGARSRAQADERGLSGESAEHFKELALSGVGDVALAIGSGTKWMDGRTHGTSEERVTAARAAVNAGWDRKFGGNLEKFRDGEDGFKWMNSLVQRVMSSNTEAIPPSRIILTALPTASRNELASFYWR